jgi:NTP pyrophosphatase (non-canonical NTP hydrolase)
MSLTLKALREANETRQREWDRDERITLAYRSNEFGGEVGEALDEAISALLLGAAGGRVQNIAKKLERERLGIRGSRSTLERLAEELADVVICADLLAMHEGIDLAAAVKAKFNATSAANGLATRLEDSP